MKVPGLKAWRTIQTGPGTRGYRDGWDRTFGRAKAKKDASTDGVAFGCFEWTTRYGESSALVCSNHRRGRDCENCGPRPRAPWEPDR